MTDKSLQTRLQEADQGSRELDREIWEAFDPVDFAQVYRTMKGVCPEGSSDDYIRAQMFTHKRYTTSLDAALALVREVLPGWDWTVSHEPGEGSGAIIEKGNKAYFTHHKSPAIALCLALLAADTGGGDETD